VVGGGDGPPPGGGMVGAVSKWEFGGGLRRDAGTGGGEGRSHAEAIVFRRAGPAVYRYPVDIALYRYDDDIIAPAMLIG